MFENFFYYLQSSPEFFKMINHIYFDDNLEGKLPKKIYHGSYRSDIFNFKRDFKDDDNDSDINTLGGGLYLTDNIKMASNYAYQRWSDKESSRIWHENKRNTPGLCRESIEAWLEKNQNIAPTIYEFDIKSSELKFIKLSGEKSLKKYIPDFFNFLEFGDYELPSYMKKEEVQTWLSNLKNGELKKKKLFTIRDLNYGEPYINYIGLNNLMQQHIMNLGYDGLVCYEGGEYYNGNPYPWISFKSFVVFHPEKLLIENKINLDPLKYKKIEY